MFVLTPTCESVIKTLRPAPHHRRRLRTALLLPMFALALVAALSLALSYQIDVEREAAHDEAVGHSAALAFTLADHASHILRQSEHAGDLFKLKYEETHGALRLAEFTRHGGLLDSVLPSKLDLPSALIDRHGDVIDSMHGFGHANVAERGYFQRHLLGHDEAALFSAEITEPRTKKWQIVISRRLTDGAGQFAGVFLMMIDPAYFVDDYDRLNLDEQGALVLMHRDTGLAVGRVGERLIISDRLDFVAPHEASASTEELRVRQSFDPIRRIYAARDMPRFGLMAIVGSPEPMAMAKFERRRTLYWSTLAAACVMIMAVVALLMRQSARLRASTRAAHEAQAMLRGAAEGSLDAVFILQRWPAKPGPVQDFVVVDINQRGATLLGTTRAELLGQRICERVPEARNAVFFDCYVQVLASGKALEEEFELRLVGRAPRWLHRQIVPLENGVAITTRDISERKHAELELRHNRNFLQSLIAHLPLLIYVKSVRPDSFGQMIIWNDAAESLTGHAAAEVVGRSDSEAFPLDFALHNRASAHDMLAHPRVIDQPELAYTCSDGKLHYLHAVAVPLEDEQGRIEYILGIAEDVTGRRAQEQALRKNQAELAAVNDASPLGLVRSDQAGLCTYVNRTFELITGMARAQALGNGWIRAIHPDDRVLLENARGHFDASAEPFQATLRCQHQDGKIVWTTLKIAAIRVDGAIEGFASTIDDITTLREAAIALRESEARLRTIADTLPTMIAYLDAEQRYRFFNTAYEREFGWVDLQVLGNTVEATVGAMRFALLQPFIARVLGGETVMFEEEDIRDGHERHIEVTYIPQISADEASVIGFHVMRQDVSAQKREKKRLVKLAQIDALTGLTNRAGFLQKLGDAMYACATEGKLMAVMFMDIDHFKPVNDTYGHHVGDALLKGFSTRLTHTLRASDTIARLGGDEFTIIMENIHHRDDAHHIAAKIVTAMQAPFDLDGIVVSISASIGVAYYRDAEIGPDALLKQADVLLYKAKQAGRNTYRSGA